MQEKIKKATGAHIADSGGRNPALWQRRLAPPHASAKELKYGITAYTYGKGESAEKELREALPWLASAEREQLFAYHGLLRGKILAEWQIIVLQANPDLKIDYVEKKSLFDSSNEEAFGKLVRWLGRYVREDLDKMQNGDSEEFHKKKSVLVRGSERYIITIEKRDGVFKAYRGIDEFVVRGEVSQEISSLLFTEAACREFDAMLLRLSETANLLDPRAGSGFDRWGKPFHTYRNAELNILLMTDAALEGWYAMERLKSEAMEYVEKGELVLGEDKLGVLPDSLGHVRKLGLELANPLWGWLINARANEFGKYLEKLVELNSGMEIEPIVKNENGKLVVDFSIVFKFSAGNLEETVKISELMGERVMKYNTVLWAMNASPEEVSKYLKPELQPSNHGMHAITQAIICNAEQEMDFGKLKSGVRKYIAEGKMEYAESRPGETMVLPVELRDGIGALDADGLEKLKAFVNIETTRHFGDYCQKMQELFPDWFEITTREVWHFPLLEIYVEGEDLEKFLGDPAKKKMGAERMTGFELARFGPVPPDKIGEAVGVEKRMLTQTEKISELTACIQSRYLEADGTGLGTGHASLGGFLGLFYPVIADMDMFLAIEQQKSASV